MESVRKLKKIIKKYQLKLYRDTQLIAGVKNISQEDMIYITKYKDKIRDVIIKENKKQEKIKKREKEKKYAHLKTQLPPLRKYNTKNNDKKAQEFLDKANKISYYSDDDEDDGLNLAVSSNKEKIRKEARKYCNHDFDISYYKTYTADARKLLERTVECKKCGLYYKDKVSDPLSEETIRGM